MARRSRGRSQTRHEKGQPVLVGTISVEVSELLGRAARASAASRTRCSTPSPSTPSARARSIAEAGRPGAVTIATNMAGRGVDIKLGGNAEHLTRIELAKLGLKPGDPDYDERFAEVLPDASRRASRRTARRSSRPAACSSSAPSATSRAASTTSSAAAPAARATPASRASSSPPRTTSSACSPATASTASSTASARPTRRATRSRSRPKMLSKQIEKAQRKVEEQNFLHPQARPRVRRRDEPAARGRLQLPRRGARGPRHGRPSRASRSPR